jgi:peptidoglycan/xylan/chitin deacetylase (PgdA/CDA1 family)
LTACVLARHAPTIRSFVERGVEFAVHGLVHNDHAVRGLAEQRQSIHDAMAIFDAAGVPYRGFRAPYLRYNANTERALRELGVSYHSSQAITFPVLATEIDGARLAAYRRVLELYGALDSEQMVVRPRVDDGLVRIPVSLPDDESMIERLRLDSGARTRTWTAMLDLSHRRGDLFTVQLHPERIFELADALENVLADAGRRKPVVWIARLAEIATWWRRRERSLLRVETTSMERHRVRLEADLDATLLVRGVPDVSVSPWDGNHLVSRSRDFEVATARKPAVGVSLRAPEDVVSFLREEGFACERSGDRSSYGAYVDTPGDAWSERGILEQIDASPGPLVRLSRWPGGAKSALAITGDIDSVTLQDFLWRVLETRRPKADGAESESGARV